MSSRSPRFGCTPSQNTYTPSITSKYTNSAVNMQGPSSRGILSVTYVSVVASEKVSGRVPDNELQHIATNLSEAYHTDTEGHERNPAHVQGPANNSIPYLAYAIEGSWPIVDGMLPERRLEYRFTYLVDPSENVQQPITNNHRSRANNQQPTTNYPSAARS